MTARPLTVRGPGGSVAAGTRGIHVIRPIRSARSTRPADRRAGIRTLPAGAVAGPHPEEGA